MPIPAEPSQWTVLVIEDDPDNREVAVQLLELYGAQVQAACDGVEGLNLLANLWPTFVLLDLSMPHMDGWETLQHIRADPRTASLPVIALTAHAMEEMQVAALQAGFDAFITKPFFIDRFIQDVQRCLAQIGGD